MELEDFLPTYPDYELDPTFSIYEDELTSVIQQKKEFRDLTLGESEPRPENPGDLLKHQLFLQRFMSGHTPYNGILLWHAVGTGKTGSAIAIAEGLKGTFKKSLILVRSDTFIRNFKNELANVMTKGIYLPQERLSRPLTEMERTKRTNKLISQYYEFGTFQVFSKMYRETKDKNRFLEFYSNRLVVIDEVHNLRQKNDKGTYDSIFTFLHEIRDCKVVLLSATPIKDQAHEFSSIMNLILPLDREEDGGTKNQLPIGDAFISNYFSDGILEKSKELIERVKGRISYLQPTRSDVNVVEAGDFNRGSPFRQVNCELSDYQRELYLKAFNEDTKQGDSRVDENIEEKEEGSSTLYHGSINSSLCVGEEASIKQALKEGKSEDEKLKILSKFSTKYHYIMKNLLQHPENNAFIYCRGVKGQGIEMIRVILEEFAFSKVETSTTLSLDTRRYAVITGETLESYTEAVLKEFNSPTNAIGRKIQVIIGSAAIGEGRSLMSVRDIYITSPYWNFTDMDQAVGRGIRYGSHRYLAEGEKKVTIHRLRLDLPEKNIDDKMIQIAFEKDSLGKQIEAAARTAAIDCNFNYRRNLKQDGVDRSRNCLYEECEYKCAVDMKEEVLVDTYNLFYTEKEYQEIKKALQKMFSLRFNYSLDEILREISTYSSLVLLRSITNIIHRREAFTNPIGFVSYLKERGGVFFLVNDPHAPSESSYVYQTKLGQPYPIQKFETYAKKYPVKNLTKILLTGEDLIAKLDPEIQNDLLKQAIYEEYVERKRHPIIDTIKEMACTSLVENDDGTVFQVGNQILDINVGKWVDQEEKYGVDLPEEERLEKFYRLVEKLTKEKEFSYYGILTEKGLKLSNFRDIPRPSAKGTVIGTGSYNMLKLEEISDALKELIGRELAKDSKENITTSLERLNLVISEEDNEKLKKMKAPVKPLKKKCKKGVVIEEEIE